MDKNDINKIIIKKARWKKSLIKSKITKLVDKENKLILEILKKEMIK